MPTAVGSASGTFCWNSKPAFWRTSADCASARTLVSATSRSEWTSASPSPTNPGEVGRRVDALGGRLDALAAQLEETPRAMREAQDDTSYKLNALIQTVDKLARRNGAGGA